jgi:hypothetical protein
MKTKQQMETEAILSMAKTIEELTQQVKILQQRIAMLEATRIPQMYPAAPSPYYPWYKPYEVTCTTVNGIVV